MRNCFAALLGCIMLLVTGPVLAADTGTDPSLEIAKYIQHFVVDTDGSYTLTIDKVKDIKLARAVQAHSQHYISYNRTLDEVVSVDGYTQKPDGRRVNVQPEQIRDQQETASSDAPMFQDTRVKVVVFPDVAVGDRLVVRYVIKRVKPLFPGQFEDLSSSEFYSNKQFQLIYDMPESMPLYADAVGFEPMPIDSPPGRKRYQWQYVGSANERIEAESVSYLDYGKRLAVATFPDYASFARAYESRASIMARPDERIHAVARDVTSGLKDQRAKALALSEWVRRHIRYVAVYVGPGGIVPHPAATVLENRYGDCKDHAILLEALLDAVGIDSTAALINGGNAYRLPSTPTLGIFNHVINYVPELDLFLDSTAESIAAGYLPPNELDKPVLLTKTGVIRRTPSGQAERHRTVMNFKVHKNGSSQFMIARETRGAVAEPYRQAVRDTKQSDRDLFVQRMLQGFGQKGGGVFDAGKLDSNGDEYRLALTGTSENFVNLPGPTGLGTLFNFWGGLGDTVFSFAQEKDRKQDFVCPAVEIEDDTRFEFPRGVSILTLPKALTIRDENFSYSSSYARTGSTVAIKRRVAFKHAGMTCTPAEFKRMQPVLDQMIRDLKSQIIVKAA